MSALQFSLGYTRIGGGSLFYSCQNGVPHLTGVCVPTYYLVGSCQSSNQSNHSLALAATSMSPAVGSLTAESNNLNVSFFFNGPIEAGRHGAITFTPSDGTASMSVDVRDEEVSFESNNTMVVRITKPFPSSTPFTTYTATFGSGVVVQPGTGTPAEACCAKTFVSEHHQCPGNRGGLYSGQINLRDSFRVEFNVAMHDSSDETVPIFSFGQGAVHQFSVLQHAIGRNKNTSTLDIHVHDYNAPNVGHSVMLGIDSHWIVIWTNEPGGTPGTRTCSMEVHQDSVKVHEQAVLTCPSQRAHVPVMVGSAKAFFTLRNLIVHNSEYNFTLSDRESPIMVDHTPKSTASGLMPHESISFTFNKLMRPGSGKITLTPSSGAARSFDTTSPEVKFAGTVITVMPHTPLSDTHAYVITVDKGAMQSAGGWHRLLVDHVPVISTPLVCLNVTQIWAELECYTACRDTNTCIAFRAGIAGENLGQCCLFSAYNLAVTTSQHEFTHPADAGINSTYTVYSSGGVLAAPGEIFSEIGTIGYMNDTGIAYGGLAGPNTIIKGSISLGGLSETDFQDSKVQLAFTTALANCLSSEEVTISQDQVKISLQNRRSGGNVVVFYKITIPSPPGQMPMVSVVSSVSSQLGQIAGNSTFLQNFRNEAQTLGALTIALNTLWSALGSVPVVSQASTTFQFVISDLTGPVLLSYLPVQGATDIDPSSTIKLQFSEGVQAGSGKVLLSHEDGEQRGFDISSTKQVRFVDNTVYITPEKWLKAGKFTVSMPSGAILDDAHPSASHPVAFAGIAPGVYSFTVKSLPQPPVQTPHLSMGVGSGREACLYAMVEPFFHCRDFAECTLFLNQIGEHCVGSSSGEPLHRVVTWSAMQAIGKEGARRNMGDGRDVLLSMGSGGSWPQNVIGEFA